MRIDAPYVLYNNYKCIKSLWGFLDELPFFTSGLSHLHSPQYCSSLIVI